MSTNKFVGPLSKAKCLKAIDSVTALLPVIRQLVEAMEYEDEGGHYEERQSCHALLDHASKMLQRGSAVIYHTPIDEPATASDLLAGAASDV